MKETEFLSSADYNTSYRIADSVEEVIKLLQRDSTMLFKCFPGKQMKVNISKCHLLVNKKNEFVINLGETKIKKSEYEKLLGIKVDTKLKFDEDLNDIKLMFCLKISTIFGSKKKIMMNSFFNSKFRYSLLSGCSIVAL